MCSVGGITFHTSERQFFILLKIICNNRCREVVNFNEPAEIHSRISLLVFLKMFYEKWYFQKLVTFAECHQVYTQ